jgi:NADH:ubiquinone oxidoreductase subunit F (NADH-binding)/(2Fe-2S) ferredoxin
MESIKCISSPEDLEKLRHEIRTKRELSKPTISVCTGTGCIALGALNVIEALKNELNKQSLEDRVEIRETGCLGFCGQGPMLIIYPEEICYFKIKPKDIPEIISKTIGKHELIKRLLYKDPITREVFSKVEENPFYKYQSRVLLENNAKIDPRKIEDYIAIGGYGALAKALFQMTPEQVISNVKNSNLRGRGGGGFPTGRKWETCRNAPGTPKYAIVNCSEGDPTAFKDRALMEANPHAILEGLLIGMYAMGASEGFVYVREEYPLAAERMELAVKDAEKTGFVGEDIMGSGLSFRVEVHRGAGMFVSGESTALMSAIEGKIGEPRSKYIHTAVKGLYEKPTDLNNVETWMNIPIIISNGAEWFKSIGTKGSTGTKVFSLVGKVNNGGLVEVPMGTTLRDVVYKIGGGVKNGKKLKAVQVGGPGGGFVNEEMLNIPVDFDEMDRASTSMVLGSVVVLDEDTCIVDLTRYFAEFLSEESCGKCIPCREGLRVLSKILNDSCEGKGKEEDMLMIEDIIETMKESSLCALGSTAVNPVLTALKYFRDEYEMHVKERRCSAKVCENLKGGN